MGMLWWYGMVCISIRWPTVNGFWTHVCDVNREDYNWTTYGWQVIMNPKPSDLQAGDVVNWQAGGALSPGIYGHTGIITDVSYGGQHF